MIMPDSCRLAAITLGERRMPEPIISPTPTATPKVAPKSRRRCPREEDGDMDARFTKTVPKQARAYFAGARGRNSAGLDPKSPGPYTRARVFRGVVF
jgi:hypothetical protein